MGHRKWCPGANKHGHARVSGAAPRGLLGAPVARTTIASGKLLPYSPGSRRSSMASRLSPPPGGARIRALGLLVAASFVFLNFGCAGGGKTTPTGKGGSSATGSAGTPGSAGVTGTAGTAAAAGNTGAAGTSSVAGSTGASGTTGAAGTAAAAGTTGAAGTTASAGTTGSSGTSGNTDAGTDTVCQTAQYKFEPKIPSVFVLVDRSGSEFTSCEATTGTFFSLRSAALSVIKQLEGQVRFGLGVFAGGHTATYGCPVWDTVQTGLNNFNAINTLYSKLGSLPCSVGNGDTPAVQVIPLVKAALKADTGTGQKYMMVVTDSETDFCDNGGKECPADAVTYQIQDLYTAGFGTLVIGLPSELSGVAFSTAVLQGFANAGAGQPVALPPSGSATTASQLYYSCTGAGAGQWMTLYSASGRTGTNPLATYSPTGGTAKVYAPGSDSEAALAAVKSCVFDLGDVGGKSIKVDLMKLDQAHVLIENSQVPQSDTNGWKMNSPTQLELVGTACTTWRMPNNTNIDFQFPCSTIIFE